MAQLDVELNGLKLKNPVILASGTCGYGTELLPFYDPAILGAVTLKGLTLSPRIGNRSQRLVEVRGGVLNAIGLQNMGFEEFFQTKYVEVADSGITAIANISGSSVDDYVDLSRKLDELEHITAVELNVSCPNVKEGGIMFGQDPSVLRQLVEACRKVLQKPLIVKLSPNVTDVPVMARVCEDAGADILTLINTLLGMAVNLKTRRPVIDNCTAGYSGPVLKPVALRIVHQVAASVSIPIIGMGGIMDWQDAAEFLVAGATAVGVGTATMANPGAALEILKGLDAYLDRSNIASVTDIIGTLRTN